MKKKFVTMNLSKELRKKIGKRNIPARKGDTVKVMRGKFRKKQGKITEIKLKRAKIIVEGMQTKKHDGSKANVPLKASNLQIVELNSEDKNRFGKKEEIKESNKTKQKGKQTQNAPEKTPSS